MSIKAIDELCSFINKRDNPSGLSINEIKERVAEFVKHREANEYFAPCSAGMEEAHSTKPYAISEGREIERIKIK